MTVLYDVIQDGAGTRYRVRPRVTSGGQGYFSFTEKFYETKDKRFDAEMHLGVTLDHEQTNMNIANTFAWKGFTKKGKVVSRLFLKRIYLAMDEPASEETTYTDVQIAVASVDHGDSIMPDLAYEGVLAHGWVRNFYSTQDPAQNTSVTTSPGSARTLAWTWQSPKTYDFDLLELSKPLWFSHRSNAFVSVHSAIGLAKIQAMVKFF